MKPTYCFLPKVPLKLQKKKKPDIKKVVDTNSLSLVERRKITPLQWEIDFKEVKVQEKIGNGSFGIVYKGMWRGIEVAVKKLHNTKISDEHLETFLQEITIMSRLRHPNIVLFLGCCSEEPNICFLTEYISNGNLHNLLQREKLDFSRILTMSIEVARGLVYLHAHNPPVLHRDLKSLNILVDENYHAKVCDFGLSIQVDSPRTNGEIQPQDNHVGTLNWLAPEVLKNNPYTASSDVYSFGLICWELLSSEIPYKDKKGYEIVRMIDDGELPKLPDGTDSGFGKLITDCWNIKEPEKRPSFKDILVRLKDIKTQQNRKNNEQRKQK